jgi:hypothetical protein
VPLIDQDAHDAAAYHRGYMREHRRATAALDTCEDCSHTADRHTLAGCTGNHPHNVCLCQTPRADVTAMNSDQEDPR